jgi:ribosomal protein S6--L-glutamate ligase
MMRICFLGSHSSWYFKDLQRASGGQHEITAVRFRDLHSSVSSAGCLVTGGLTDDPDVVLVRTMPAASLEQVVFRMDALARLQDSGKLVVNPPRAIETCVDKYLATARLRDADLLVPTTWSGQTASGAMEAFEQLGGDVVLKPLFGGEGRGITRISDEALALRAFKTLEQLGAIIYMQEFVKHDGADLRILVLGSRVLGIRRRNDCDWRTNVSRGASAEPLEVSSEMAGIARRAADTVGASFAGVDLLPGSDGQLYTVEVNAVPGWRAVGQALGVDVARLLLDFLEASVG